MNHKVIVSKDSIILKMKKSKNFHVLPSMPLVRLLLLATLIDSMYITLMLRGLNGMKFAVNKLKIITQLLQLLGNLTAPELVLALFVDP